MTEKRIDYIDFMNIFACFAVVCLHCSGSVFSYGVVDDREWFLSMLIQTVAHTAVPIFFMITGITLLNYREKYDTKTFFKKRFYRTVIPFLAWSCVYIFIQSKLDGTDILDFEKWRNGIFNNEAQGVFWFFYAIWGIYLCIPVFSLIAKEENFKVMEYCCVLFFAAQAIYPLITRFVMPVNDGILPSFVLGYTGYIFVGWIICHENYSKKMRMLVYIAGIGGALLMFAGTYFLSRQAGYMDTFFMDYVSIACMPMATAVMLFAKRVRWERVYKVIPKRIVRLISSASLGVYLLHMVFVTFCSYYESIYRHPMYIMIMGPLVIYPLSLICTLVIKKTPLIQWMIP